MILQTVSLVLEVKQQIWLQQLYKMYIKIAATFNLSKQVLPSSFRPMLLLYEEWLSRCHVKFFEIFLWWHWIIFIFLKCTSENILFSFQNSWLGFVSMKFKMLELGIRFTLFVLMESFVSVFWCIKVLQRLLWCSEE